MIVAVLLLAFVIAAVVAMWRAGNAAVPQREREALETIRKHGRCARKAYVKRAPIG